MIDRNELRKFIEPYYVDKDIMHNMWHIELVEKQMNRIIELGRYDINREYLSLALAFHGFIYKDETKIKKWLKNNGYSQEDIKCIVKIAWESQRPEIPKLWKVKFCTMPMCLKAARPTQLLKHLLPVL